MVAHPQAFHFGRFDVANHVNVTRQPVPNFPFLTVLLTSCLGSLRNIEKQSIVAVQEQRSHEPNTLRDDDRSVAEQLAKKVRVLCMVMTQPSNHLTKARHVKATWGKRCNKLLFMSSKKGTKLPAINLRVANRSDFLWEKTKEAFRYVHQYHREDADWFMKADDNTYVVVENLRYMVSEHNSTDPIYFGGRFKKSSTLRGDIGGVGQVLSKGALDRFVNKGLLSPYLCKAGKSGAEDETMDICLHQIGVKAMDSRDSFGRHLFLPFGRQDQLFPSKNDTSFWNPKNIYDPTDEYFDCCSEHAVSFHYVRPQDMYAIDYLIYYLRPYGMRFGPEMRTIGRNLTKGKAPGAQY